MSDRPQLLLGQVIDLLTELYVKHGPDVPVLAQNGLQPSNRSPVTDVNPGWFDGKLEIWIDAKP